MSEPDRTGVPRKGYFRFEMISDVASLDDARLMLEDCLINEWSLQSVEEWAQDMWDSRLRVELYDDVEWNHRCAIGGSFLLLAVREVASTRGR